MLPKRNDLDLRVKPYGWISGAPGLGHIEELLLRKVSNPELHRRFAVHQLPHLGRPNHTGYKSHGTDWRQTHPCAESVMPSVSPPSTISAFLWQTSRGMASRPRSSLPSRWRSIISRAAALSRLTQAAVACTPHGHTACMSIR